MNLTYLLSLALITAYTHSAQDDQNRKRFEHPEYSQLNPKQQKITAGTSSSHPTTNVEDYCAIFRTLLNRRIICVKPSEIEEAKTILSRSMRTALILESARWNDIDSMRFLLHHHTDVNSAADDGWTALHIACSKGHSNSTKYLLEAGANLHALTKDKRRPIWFAVKNKHRECIQALMRKRVAQQKCSEDNSKQQETASSSATDSLVKTLDAAPTQGQGSSSSSSSHPADVEDWCAVFKTLLEQRKARIDQSAIEKKGSFLSRAMHTALIFESARWDDIDCMRFLIRNGADINSADCGGITGLHVACHRGSLNITKYLIELGANVDVEETANEIRLTPLIYAISKRHRQIVQALISAGAQINRKGADNETPLDIAVCQGDREIAQDLIAAGADKDAQTLNFGATPLHRACVKGYREIAQDLIAAGADLNLKSWETFDTPLHVAVEYGHREIVNDLIGAGANTTLKNSCGSTPLTLACYYGHLGIVQDLIKLTGCEIEAKSLRAAIWGKHPINEIRVKHTKILAYLMDTLGISAHQSTCCCCNELIAEHPKTICCCFKGLYCGACITTIINSGNTCPTCQNPYVDEHLIDIREVLTDCPEDEAESASNTQASSSNSNN